jgi:hypothetical protein
VGCVAQGNIKILGLKIRKIIEDLITAQAGSTPLRSFGSFTEPAVPI